LKNSTTGYVGVFACAIFTDFCSCKISIPALHGGQAMAETSYPDSQDHFVGVLVKAAISIGLSSKGYYRLAKTKAVQIGLNNAWLKAQGVVSLKEQWVKIRFPNG
jgi:hypothetical protein